MRICHPASWRGSGLFFRQTQGFRLRPAGYAETGTPWAMVIPPIRAQNSATLTLRKLLYKFQFCVSLKQYSLIAGAIKNATSRITSDEARLAKHQRNSGPAHSRNKAQFKAQFKAFAYTSDVYNKHTTTQFKAQFKAQYKAQNRLQMGCFSKGAGHILAGGPNWKGDLPGLRTNEAPPLKGTCEIPLAFASQVSLLRHSYFVIRTSRCPPPRLGICTLFLCYPGASCITS